MKRATPPKEPEAFKTVGEVSDILGLPQHVLRFWMERFPQLKPVKSGGGRAYYRPDDIALLLGIRHLLYEKGYSVKEAQKLIREKGAKHVAALATNEGGAMAPSLRKDLQEILRLLEQIRANLP